MGLGLGHTAAEGSNPGLAGTAPGWPATHTCESRLGRFGALNVSKVAVLTTNDGFVNNGWVSAVEACCGSNQPLHPTPYPYLYS